MERINAIVQDDRLDQQIDLIRVRIALPSKLSFAQSNDPYQSRDNRLHPIMVYTYKKEVMKQSITTTATTSSPSTAAGATPTTTKTMHASAAMLKLFCWSESNSSSSLKLHQQQFQDQQSIISLALKEYEIQRRLWSLDSGLFIKPIGLVRGWEGEIEREIEKGREQSSSTTTSSASVSIADKRITECVEGEVEYLSDCVGIIYEQCTGLTLATWLAEHIIANSSDTSSNISHEDIGQLQRPIEEEKNSMAEEQAIKVDDVASTTQYKSEKESKGNKDDDLLSILLSTATTLGETSSFSDLTISRMSSSSVKLRKGDPLFYHDGLGSRVRGGGRVRDPMMPLKQQQEISLHSTARKTQEVHAKGIKGSYPSFGGGKTRVMLPLDQIGGSRKQQKQVVDERMQPENENQDGSDENKIDITGDVIPDILNEVPEETKNASSAFHEFSIRFPLIDRLILLERLSDVLHIAHQHGIILEGFHPGSFLAIDLHQSKMINGEKDQKGLIWKYLYDSYSPQFMSRYDSFELDVIDSPARIQARLHSGDGESHSSPAMKKKYKQVSPDQNTTKAVNCCNFGWMCLEIMTFGIHPLPALIASNPCYPMTSIWEIGQIDIADTMLDYALNRSMLDQEQVELYIQRCLAPYQVFSSNSPTLSHCVAAFVELAEMMELLCVHCLQVNPTTRCNSEEISEMIGLTMSISMDHLTLLPLSTSDNVGTDMPSDTLLPEFVPPADDGAGSLGPALWDEPCIDMSMMWLRKKNKNTAASAGKNILEKTFAPLYHEVKKVSIKRPLPRRTLSIEEAKHLRQLSGRYLPAFYGHCSLVGRSYVVEYTAFGSLEHFFSLISPSSTSALSMKSLFTRSSLYASNTSNRDNGKQQTESLLIHKTLTLLPIYHYLYGTNFLSAANSSNTLTNQNSKVALNYEVVALQWIQDLVRAIHHLHYFGYCHGHLSPANVWIYPSSSHSSASFPNGRLSLKLHGIHLIQHINSTANTSDANTTTITASAQDATSHSLDSVALAIYGANEDPTAPSSNKGNHPNHAGNNFSVYEAIECKFGHSPSYASDIFSFGMLALYILQGDGKDPKPFEMERQLRRILSTTNSSNNTKSKVKGHDKDNNSKSKRYQRFPLLELKLLQENPSLTSEELEDEMALARMELMELILTCFKFDYKSSSKSSGSAMPKESVTATKSFSHSDKSCYYYGRFNAIDLERKYSRWIDDVLCYSIPSSSTTAVTSTPSSSSSAITSMSLTRDWKLWEELLMKVMTGKESVPRLVEIGQSNGLLVENNIEDEKQDEENSLPVETPTTDSLTLEEVDYARVVIQSTSISSTTCSTNSSSSATNTSVSSNVSHGQRRLKHATMASTLATTSGSMMPISSTFHLRSIGYGLLYPPGFNKDKLAAPSSATSTVNSNTSSILKKKLKASAMSMLFGVIANNANNNSEVAEAPSLPMFKEPEPVTGPPHQEIMQVTVSILYRQECFREATLLHLLSKDAIHKESCVNPEIEEDSLSISESDQIEKDSTFRQEDDVSESTSAQMKSVSEISKMNSNAHQYFLSCYGFTYPNSSTVTSSTTSSAAASQILDFAVLYECPNYGTLQSFLFAHSQTGRVSSSNTGSTNGTIMVKNMLISNALRLLWLLDIVKGVNYLHSVAGLVHGDLQPEHIYLSSHLRVKLGGFSCCAASSTAKDAMVKALENSPDSTAFKMDEDDDSEEIPPSNLLYMAPELRIGLTAPTCASDIFAIGMIAVQLFTGIPPSLSLQTPITHLRDQMDSAMNKAMADKRLRQAVKDILSPCFPPSTTSSPDGEGEEQDMVALSLTSAALRPSAQSLEESLTRLLKAYHWLSSPIPVVTLQRLLCPVTRNPSPQLLQLYEYLGKSGQEIALNRLVIEKEQEKEKKRTEEQRTEKEKVQEYELLTLLGDPIYETTEKASSAATMDDSNGMIRRYKFCKLLLPPGTTTVGATLAPPPLPSSKQTVNSSSYSSNSMVSSSNALSPMVMRKKLPLSSTAASTSSLSPSRSPSTSGKLTPSHQRRRSSVTSFSTMYNGGTNKPPVPPLPPPPPPPSSSPLRTDSLPPPAATPPSPLRMKRLAREKEREREREKMREVCLKFPFPGEEDQLLREALCLSKIQTVSTFAMSPSRAAAANSGATATSTPVQEEMSALLGCYGFARYDAGFFLVLEASPLGSVEDLIQSMAHSLLYTGKRATPLPLNIITDIWLGDIARGLTALHAKGFVHSRLSPRKCLLFYGGGRIKIGGLSQAFRLSERERDLREREREREKEKQEREREMKSGRGTGIGGGRAKQASREREKITAYATQYLAPELKYSLSLSSVSAAQSSGVGVGYTSDIYSLAVIALQLFAAGLPQPPRKNVVGATAVTADAMKGREYLLQELRRVIDLRFPVPVVPPVVQSPAAQANSQDDEEGDDTGDAQAVHQEEQDEDEDIGEDFYQLLSRCLSYDESIELPQMELNASNSEKLPVPSNRDNLTYGRPTARKFEEILRDIIRRSEYIGKEEVRLTVREKDATSFDDFLRESLEEIEDYEEEEAEEEQDGWNEEYNP